MATSSSNTVHVWKVVKDPQSIVGNRAKEETSWRRFDVDVKSSKAVGALTDDARSAFVALVGAGQTQVFRFSLENEKDKGSLCATIQ